MIRQHAKSVLFVRVHQTIDSNDDAFEVTCAAICRYPCILSVILSEFVCNEYCSIIGIFMHYCDSLFVLILIIAEDPEVLVAGEVFITDNAV